MDRAFGHLYSAAQELRSGTPRVVRTALVAARERTLHIAQAYERALEPAGLRVPYQPTVNPPLWEWGHVAWFQEYWIGRNRQRAQGIHADPAHARSPSLLADADKFYDSSRVAHRDRWELPIPASGRTRAYLADTLEQTLALLDELPEDASDAQLYFFRLVTLHEEMHSEAAVYMARALDVELPVMTPRPLETAQRVIPVPAQVFRLGSGPAGFAFDNELEAHDVQIDAFEIDAQPVTWGRFLPFAQAGGYTQRSWWDEAGWDWLRQMETPVHELQGHDPAHPAVHLSAHEAQAWCKWAGRRLPTEAQWECAALTAPGFDWGSVWEWTASDFVPYPGFAPHPYREYSQPWFGTRRVLRGACAATSPALAHPRYRNFFEPGRNDVFAGFRSCA